jgi:hypothetical protein
MPDYKRPEQQCAEVDPEAHMSIEPSWSNPRMGKGNAERQEELRARLAEAQSCQPRKPWEVPGWDPAAVDQSIDLGDDVAMSARRRARIMKAAGPGGTTNPPWAVDADGAPTACWVEGHDPKERIEFGGGGRTYHRAAGECPQEPAWAETPGLKLRSSQDRHLDFEDGGRCDPDRDLLDRLNHPYLPPECREWDEQVMLEHRLRRHDRERTIVEESEVAKGLGGGQVWLYHGAQEDHLPREGESDEDYQRRLAAIKRDAETAKQMADVVMNAGELRTGSEPESRTAKIVNR